MTSQLRAVLQGRAPLIGVLAMAIAGIADSMQAVSIPLDLGRTPHVTSRVDPAFNALNGMSVAGQTLSLNFMFTNNEFVRFFTVTSDSFEVLITLQTNSTGLVGFLDGAGFLVDQQGNPLQQPQELGSASGDNGSMAAGLFPLVGGGLPRPIDSFGVHFDLLLPTNPSFSITDARFTLESGPGQPFGVGPGVPRDIVPEVDSTFLLLSFGLLVQVLGRMRLMRAG